jgi:hypothetical protein
MRFVLALAWLAQEPPKAAEELLSLRGEAERDRFGRIAVIRDLDGDRCPELVVGAPMRHDFSIPGGVHVGAVYVFSGGRQANGALQRQSPRRRARKRGGQPRRRERRRQGRHRRRRVDLVPRRDAAVRPLLLRRARRRPRAAAGALELRAVEGWRPRALPRGRG